MPGRELPTAFAAGRTLRLEGVTYAKGDVIPNDVVARLHDADALLSQRWIIPDTEARPRKGDAARRAKPRPTSLSTGERRSLLS